MLHVYLYYDRNYIILINKTRDCVYRDEISYRNTAIITEQQNKLVPCSMGSFDNVIIKGMTMNGYRILVLMTKT